MSLGALALLAQLAAGAGQPVAPVLAFPEPGLDDTAAYQGYRTRLFRDAAGNTVQVYVEGRAGRVVHLLADAENASIGLTAQDGRGRPVAVRWDGPGAEVARGGPGGRTRTLAHPVVVDAPTVRLGGFVLGTMRVERDYQHARAHERPLGATAHVVPELARLAAGMARLQPTERRRQLALLGAPDLATLEARLRPTVTLLPAGGGARVVQPSLDGRDTLAVELLVDAARVTVSASGDGVTLGARDGASVPLTVRIATTGPTLTPLAREEIFTPAFLAFLARERAAGEAPDAPAPVRAAARRLERQARGVELLVSREKLMAGLPTYATYFGRDMLVTALMMRPIWRPEMSEFAIAAALRKLEPTTAEVSHEEALGAQASREAAAEWVALIEAQGAARRRGAPRAADSLLARSRAVLAAHRRPRENYHMVDDELQLPVLVARWIADSTVSAERRRAFLLDSSDGGGPRVARLLGELALVARLTAPYAERPVVANLVAFPRRDDGAGYTSRSWRDSGAGYADGRWAMDVNAVWAPHALAAIGEILAELRTLGLAPDSLAAARPVLAPLVAADAPLGRWMRDPAALERAVATWRGAERHFVVRLAPDAVRRRVAARLAAMPAAERTLWQARAAQARADADSLVFLDVALDAAGRPTGVVNSDVATRLFLEATASAPLPAAAAADARRDAALFTRAYPVGLLVPEAGPVVANDAPAAPAVWAAFARDPYHGPRVVWGREVNLFLLGAAAHVARAPEPAVRAAIGRVNDAVEASGFHSELWSYEVRDGRVVPVRYGTGADVQLWSTTDLAVRYVLAGLRP